MEGNKRWYDEEPKTATAINMLLLFPREIQKILGSGVCRLAEREFEAGPLLVNLKSLGGEKVLALYKSGDKRRCYDSLPGMHAAINYLYLMGQENRELLVDKIRELTNCMAHYLQVCKMTSRKISVQEIDKLTQTYVKGGAKLAKSIIRQIEKTEKESQNKPEVYADSSGMRLAFRDE